MPPRRSLLTYYRQFATTSERFLLLTFSLLLRFFPIDRQDLAALSEDKVNLLLLFYQQNPIHDTVERKRERLSDFIDVREGQRRKVAEEVRASHFDALK
jgi:hypothetical protein